MLAFPVARPARHGLLAGRFLTPLDFVLDFTHPRHPALLSSPLIFQSETGRLIEVPTGFHSDLASIPAFARVFIGKLERHAPAAAVHDFLYATQPVSRREADHLFLEAMAAMQVPVWKRRLMYWAVRKGGGRAWERYQTKENSNDMTMIQEANDEPGEERELIKGLGQKLSPGTIERVAQEIIGCAPAALDAVIRVETCGFGYDPDGYLVCLPELHKVGRYLPKSKRVVARARGLVRSRWSPKQYRGLSSYRRNAELAGRRRRELWGRIAKIDERAAYLATSWGLPQIMGFNYRLAGFSSVTDMVRAFADSEDAQIEAMGRFIVNSGLADELCAQDWRGFARGYNGPGQVDRYARLLAEAYERSAFAKADVPEPAAVVRDTAMRMGEYDSARVKALQEQLSALGYHVDADGDFGPETRFAVQRFQHENGLAADGLAGPKTLAALEDAPEREPSSKPLAQTIRDDARVQTGIGQAIAGVAAASAVAAEKAAPNTDALKQTGAIGKQMLEAVEPWRDLIALLSGNLTLLFIALAVAGGVWAATRGVAAHRARRWFG